MLDDGLWVGGGELGLETECRGEWWRWKKLEA